MRICLLALLFLAGCTARKAPSPEALYAGAMREMRAGELRQALDHSESGLREFSARPGSLWYWKFRLLKAETLASMGKTGDALGLLNGTIPSTPEFAPLRTRMFMIRGYALQLRSEYAAARTALDEALRMAESAGDRALAGEVRLRRGTASSRQGVWADAEADFRSALDAGRESGDAILEANALGSLGFNRLNAFRFDEAIPFFEQSLALAEKAGAKRAASKCIGNLGYCYASLGEHNRALQYLARAAAMAREMGDLASVQIWLGDIAGIYVYFEDYPAAAAHFRQALEIARQVGDLSWTSKWLRNIATTYIEAGDLVSAELFNNESLALKRKLTDRRSEAYSLLNAARIAAGRRQFPESERLYRETIGIAKEAGAAVILWEAQTNLAKLLASRRRWGDAEAQFQEAVATMNRAWGKLSREEWKFSLLSRAMGFHQAYIDFLMERGETARALETAESCRARVLAERLGIDQVSAPPGGAARYRETARSANAVLLSYWLARRRSFLWVVTAAGIASYTLPPDSEIERQAEAYKSAILRLQDTAEVANPAGRWLYEKLLGPAREHLGPESRVVVVPDGVLHGLNLETLPVPADSPRYWIDDATVAVAPSLELVARGERPAVRPEKALLMIGDPAPVPAGMDPLPGAGEEVGSIRSLFPGVSSEVFTGSRAVSDSYLRARPERFRYIHFASHATANRDNPLDSAVLLSAKSGSGKLYARTVKEHPLRADLVTVSSCRSAGARAYSGEGLVGFSWAFLHAGARGVVAGLWDVNDRSTALLMGGLYAALARGEGPAGALRSAKMKLRGGPGAYRKPYYWGPFELYARDGSLLLRRTATN